jgi:hypothetical protein
MTHIETTLRRKFVTRGCLAGLTAVFVAPAVFAQGGTPSNADVDVYVVYTPGAAALYPNGVLTRIQHVLNVTNQAYADSEVGVTLRLVGTQQITYDDKVGCQTALPTFQKNQAPFTGVEAARTAAGADLAVLMRPYVGDGIAGLAYVGGIGTQGNLSGYKSWMYSHVSINTMDYVLAHELGHNMGLVHSRRQNPAGGTYSYSAGFGIDGVLTDIMAYPTAFATTEATKVYQFANPLHTVNGHAIGVASTNATAGADAVKSLNAVRTTIAGFNASKQYVTSRVGEFGGDSRTDLFRLDPDGGATYLWVTGAASAPADGLGADLHEPVATGHALVASGDFDADGASDVLFRGGDDAQEGWLLANGTPSPVAYPTLAGDRKSVV